jgi:NADH:ubiquinone oxidoreductase subunit F (NADH-binding)/(2Fe-2S) ferredoxin/NAD-dependent dihydropyrimidine dehydrogenase PreA subunit
MGRFTVADLDAVRAKAAAGGQEEFRLMVCGGTGCHATGSIAVIERLREEIRQRALGDKVRVVETGCNGFCAMGPIMVVHPGDIFYQKLTVDHVAEIIEQHLLGGKPVEKLLYKDPVSKAIIASQDDIPFFAHQMPRALRNKGLIDPESIEDYIARDGYRAAAKALLEITPETIVNEVKASGLRGRGGAGFPTGLKWAFAQASAGEVKYVLCNADEGDPGAFMDRSILEADPHAVLEGMIIAARAINAHQGYIYARTEYPLAIRRLGIAIEQAKERGLIGDDILGSGFDFHVEIYQGAGAFVCGEETALMRSIEGRRGMPRPRPPFPAHKGLWEKPTILNNVETLANVPQIVLRGGAWYASVGTETSKGTKVFALSGDVNNIGLVEVPMGTSLRTMIFDIGGGIPNKRAFKAVQLGGPSGGCVPVQYLDTPVDYEEIAKVGAIMGSGGAIVMDEDTCMVDMARFFMDFIQDESCGKCTPCREGTRRLLELLNKICDGQGETQDMEELERLSAVIKDTALCGLGQTGPNPVLSTLRYFRKEYEAHILEKRCPAKRCVALLKFEVDPELCTRCGMCFRACPVEAVEWKKKEVARIDKDKCIQCLTCFDKCKFGAIF